jgi:hypothetical protein
MAAFPVLCVLVTGLFQVLSATDTGPVEVLSMRMVLEGDGQSEELEWPVLAGGADDEALVLMGESLSYENVAGEPFEQTMTTYAEIQRGIVGSGFDVNFNSSGILDITIRIDFVGAYPSTFEHYFSFDASTGERLGIGDLILDGKLEDLAGILDTQLQENIQAAVEVYCLGPDGLAPDLYSSGRFEAADLESFSILEDGIEFHYEFGFPHMILAAEPEGEIFLSFEEIGTFLDPEGLLAGIAR